MQTELTPVSLKITQDRINAYAEITGDPNPIHLDAAFAARTEMGGIIAHGTLSMNLILRAMAATFGPDACDGAEMDIRFVKPVRVDDVVTASGTRDQDESGRYTVQITNQAGEPVIVGWVRPAVAGV
ncbi:MULTISPECIES: MaoC family dehydratase [unclassified Minwuia]|jgi:3-hydroxybutyryl-CoA dehydratase|uniref:MaoC family dehydratase n=1 Tax=unclassified Minwuia TaxID=2618799 RepID=UPI002478704A|nr:MULTISPECIES: MaoC family dehydratase [unclassified Minwuia]